MDSRESNRQPARPDDLVLRTFALLFGVVLVAFGTVGLAAGWVWIGPVARAVPWAVGVSGSIAALLIGAALIYWGVKRPRTDHPVSEEALLRLVEKYEREGNSRQLAEARERLIQLLIEKDEKKERQEPT